MSEGEVLVIGLAPRDKEAGRWPVVATAGPQVAVVRAASADLPAVAEHARLAMARTPDGRTQVLGDESALDELAPGDRLFVDAWRERPLSKPDRRGEGLPWDAPGFEPPDRPAG
ncbi:hypothetical protein G5C60_38495 [Streptomyces sp. HC44]|uniref:Uncharacterized protein n=1 Tax=Streptomyces scabichelini TaxID=2711217 RepID=A0A6G4VHQ5_9ACTN|nr:hypothetical protein [Streptomyces scabichelini]NGO13334.1 hypothetical protein [Streptomyces scabichelini]